MKRSDWMSALVILAAMAGAGWMRFRPESTDVAEGEPQSHAEWMAAAADQQRRGDPGAAADAYRAALRMDPRQSLASLRLTECLLDLGDGARLLDWMDELVLEDPRHAEQLFKLPGFRPFLREEAFLRLRDEAVIQARD